MRNILIGFQRMLGFPCVWMAAVAWLHVTPCSLMSCFPISTYLPIFPSCDAGWGTLMARLKSSGVLKYGFREEIAETMMASCRAVTLADCKLGNGTTIQPSSHFLLCLEVVENAQKSGAGDMLTCAHLLP